MKDLRQIDSRERVVRMDLRRFFMVVLGWVVFAASVGAFLHGASPADTPAAQVASERPCTIPAWDVTSPRDELPGKFRPSFVYALELPLVTRIVELHAGDVRLSAVAPLLLTLQQQRIRWQV